MRTGHFIVMLLSIFTMGCTKANDVPKTCYDADLTSLIQQADKIYLGKVIDKPTGGKIYDTSDGDYGWLIYNIEVKETFKGEVSNNQTPIVILRSGKKIEFEEISENKPYLFFVQQQYIPGKKEFQPRIMIDSKKYFQPTYFQKQALEFLRNCRV